jgi:hypothetical protein
MQEYNVAVAERIARRFSALPGFRYCNGYTFIATDLGKQGVKIEIGHEDDVGAAIILPPKEVGQCGRWLLKTLEQDRHGLPKELADILHRLSEQKGAERILEWGEKKKIKDALRILRRE